MRSCLLFCIVAGLLAGDASGLTLIRIGQPLTAAERDSLDGLGIEVLQIPWTAAHVQDQIDADSLQADMLMPRFLGEDEDIAATLLDRGGRVWVDHNIGVGGENTIVGQVLIDQDPTTAYVWPAIEADRFGTRGWWGKITFDLGGQFLIKEVRFRPLADRSDHYLETFALGVSDLVFDTYRVPWFYRERCGVPCGEREVAFVKENSDHDMRIVLDPPVTTEAIQLLVTRTSPREIGLADFEVYGGGYVTRAAYESEVVELPDIASWGEIRWSGRQDPRARVQIRSRMGTDQQPDIYWEVRPDLLDRVEFLGGGGDLSVTEYRAQYDNLAGHLKPQDVESQVTPDIENWSFWSRIYPFDQPGVEIVSPGPRQYFQIRVDFSSSTVEDGGRIDFIEAMASKPMARELVAEIFPVTTRVGEVTRFTYYVNPTIRAGDNGFDGLEISTPFRVVSVDSLRIDAVDEPFTWTRTGDGFEVLLPRRLETTDSGALVEVVFRAPVLREVSTPFAGRIFDTERPLEVRQQVSPGDAVAEVDSDQLTVQAPLSASLLFSPRFEPNPFTPNGDGVNDVVHISYKLLRLTAAAPVSIAIHDLSGRLVKRIYSGNDPLGEYDRPWDGRDEANQLVPAGLYLCRIEADLESNRETAVGVLSVAY